MVPDTKVPEAGNVTVTTTPVLSLGPLLVTVILKVTGSFIIGVSDDEIMETLMSAPGGLGR